MGDGYSVLGLNEDVAMAVRQIAKARNSNIKDFTSEVLLAHPAIFAAYIEILKSKGKDVLDLKKPENEPPPSDDYLGRL